MNALIAAFLRRPESATCRLADAVRLLAAASVIAAGLGWGWIQVAVFMLALLATLIPRALALPGALDTATGAVALVAAWSNVADLYESVPGWDKLVHGALGGLVALLSVILVQRAGALPDGHDRRECQALVGLTVVFGLATGAAWEMLEWFGHTVIDPAVHVGYDDTVADMAAGALGSLAAGTLWFRVGRGRGRLRQHSGHAQQGRQER
ncbi:hypothetical protein [Arthrobacter sp. JSM 101049]|uniref:hypothetical protein n=1 Tax=Arthrobacter sp. JSM 101049 TaxID=929097 RepID=UPI003563FB42